MSTTVNVRVGKSQLTQKLKDEAAASQRKAAQDAADGALAEQVRARAQAMRRRLEEARAKFRKSRHDPIARRDGDASLPNDTIVEDGAAIDVARVGVRRNSAGNKIFVYPWSIEDALDQRLSTDYDTAVSQAGGVGVELEFSLNDYPIAEPTIPNGQLPNNATNTSSFAIKDRGFTTGFLYDVSPAKDLLSYYYRGSFYLTPGGWGTLKSQACVDTTPTIVDYPPPGNYPSYAVGYFYLQTPGGGKSSCEIYGVYPDENPGAQSYSAKTYAPVYAEAANPAITGDERLDLYDFVLPAGGNKALYVVIARRLKRFVVVPHYLEYSIRQTLTTDQPAGTFALPDRKERLVDYDSSISVTAGAPNWESAIINEVRCVLVQPGGSFATEVTPSEQLIAACNALVKELDGDQATGTTPSKQLSFATVPSRAFELSNFPKAPYADKPPEQQVLAKQLGIGYLETSDHSGKFYTPAVFDWLAGTAKLTTRYSDVAPLLYTPASPNTPFVGVYLSVGNGTEDSIEMRATATAPVDITTAHTATDWVTVNTGSRYGDYLVWDWGNPEYCQQRLAALGMNV